MRPKILIPTILAVALTAQSADAGPIRNLLGKLRGKPRAVAAKAVEAAKAPVKALRGCAGGACR